MLTISPVLGGATRGVRSSASKVITRSAGSVTQYIHWPPTSSHFGWPGVSEISSFLNFSVLIFAA